MLTLIQQQLKALKDEHNQPLFKKVGDALQYAAVTTGVQHGAECYVVRMSERAESNQRATGPVRQRITVSIGVVIGIASRNSRHGNDDAIDSYRQAVRNSLLGWHSPQLDIEPLEYERGDLTSMHAGSVYWTERFTTRYYQEADYGA